MAPTTRNSAKKCRSSVPDVSENVIFNRFFTLMPYPFQPLPPPAAEEERWLEGIGVIDINGKNPADRPVRAKPSNPVPIPEVDDDCVIVEEPVEIVDMKEDREKQRLINIIIRKTKLELGMKVGRKKKSKLTIRKNSRKRKTKKWLNKASISEKNYEMFMLHHKRKT